MPRMKIIIGTDSEELARHAAKVVRRIEELDMKHPTSALRVRGVAAYSSQFPILCDDCGETYWARDPYASHKGCRHGKGKTGF